jgi:hypothetical protein
MKANRIFTEDPLHGVEHDEKDTCHSPPACEPVDQAAPTFEARVYTVLVDDDGYCYLQDACVAANVGFGDGEGRTQAAFCESKEDAEMCADHFRRKGELPNDVTWLENPMDAGKPLPFAVAVKVTK